MKMNNIKKLTDMCDSLVKKTGTSEIVYYRREKFEYFKKNLIPYYKKDNKYSRKNEAFPTPVFVIGERVILGLNLSLIEQSINQSR